MFVVDSIVIGDRRIMQIFVKILWREKASTDSGLYESVQTATFQCFRSLYDWNL